MDRENCFGEGNWFVGIEYGSSGVYVRDSSGRDTRYLEFLAILQQVRVRCSRQGQR
jgi:hypothetical protein